MDYQQVVDVIVAMMGVSCPIVIVCGLAARVFNAFVGMVLGKDRVRL